MDDRHVKLQAVLEADARRYKAMSNADVDTLDGILHDQFYYTHFSGLTDGKLLYLDKIRSGKVRYGMAETSGVSVFIYGATVVMHGRLQLDCFAADGRHFPLDNMFTAVWVDCGEAWRLVAWASTALSSA